MQAIDLIEAKRTKPQSVTSHADDDAAPPACVLILMHSNNKGFEARACGSISPGLDMHGGDWCSHISLELSVA